MTKTEKKILKCCKKYFKDANMIETKMLQEHMKLDKYEIASCAEHMNSNGYFEFYVKDLDNGVRFALSYKGNHSNEIAFIQMKNFLFESILVPIVVSFFTALITYLLF